MPYCYPLCRGRLTVRGRSPALSLSVGVAVGLLTFLTKTSRQTGKAAYRIPAAFGTQERPFARIG